MLMLRKLLVFLLLSSNVACAYELPERLVSVWTDIRDNLSKTFELDQKRDSLPYESWFGADKKSNDTAIQKILGRSAELLLSSSANEKRQKAMELEKDIPKQRELIEEYRHKRMTAPQSTMVPWIVSTVSDYDKKIRESEQKIIDNGKEVKKMNIEIISELNSWGLSLSEKEAEALFSTVIGDEIIKNTIIFENVKTITKKLTELASDNQDNLEIARRYYGMYIALIDILHYTQLKFIQNIDDAWKPKISDIVQKSEQTISDANVAMKNTDFSTTQKEVLKANIASNTLTVEASKRYIILLDKQRRSIQTCVEGLARDKTVAINTFQTVQNASDLSNLIQLGFKLFDSLSAMQLPQIQIFENSTIRKEFEEITRRLRK